MPRMFRVTVRFHEGRYHGLDNRRAHEWPPAPARLFQALLAGAARGAVLPAPTASALDWLQGLPPPTVVAPRHTLGQAYSSYVPNNDLDAVLPGRRYADAVAKTRVGKRIRPVLFDAAIPIVYLWSVGDDEEDEQIPALCAAAKGLYQLGRGVDMAWADAVLIDAAEAERQLLAPRGVVYRPHGGEGRPRLLCPRPGLLDSLTARFEAMRTRFRMEETARGPVRAFVQPPKPRLAWVAYGAQPHRLIFDLREPDARASYVPFFLHRAAEFVQSARDKAAEHLREAVPGLADLIDRYLVGCGAGGADKPSRVHLVPIPSVGHKEADMAIRRLEVLVPQTCPLAAEDVSWAFSRVAWRQDDGRVVRQLQLGDDPRMVARFEQPARHWRSVTPLALPVGRRRVDPGRVAEDAKGSAERTAEESRAVAAVHQALRHAGVSVPVAKVLVQREPLNRRGARAERFASATRFPKETLWHAAITFAESVQGPLLLGDGRYVGLGLMCPNDAKLPAVIAFAIVGGLSDRAAPSVVVRAARRAMLARVQDRLPHGAALPKYVSGHEADGAPARDGAHRHVAVVADLPRARLLYVAPTELQRRGVRWRDIEKHHRRLVSALEGMDALRAGSAGRLTLIPVALDPERDPLFAPTQVWENVTDYEVTRHRRGRTAEDTLRLDAAAELDRCGWPQLGPDSVEVLAVGRGPRGGLSGRLRLTFRTAQTGPLVIGRTSQKGGGLFSGRRRA